MKKIYTLALSIFFSVTLNSQNAFWTETFGTGCNQGQGATVIATPSNGAWATTSFSLPFMNGPEANEWFISSSEQSQAVNVCGGITCGGSNNRSLHIGRNKVLPPPGVVDVGASYFGGFMSFTNKRAETPVIDCSNKYFIQLSFKYILGGVPGNDYCDIEYSNDGGMTWNFLTTMPQTNNSSCGLQGLWTFYAIGLPPALSNNPNVKLGFHWYSNDPTGGSPSVAIDDMQLSVSTAWTSSPIDCAAPSGSAMITNTAVGNTSYTWTSIPPGVGFSSVNGSTTNVTYPAMGTYSLYCLGSSASSVAATSTAEIVSIIDFVSTSSVNVSSSSSLICDGSSATLTASNASSYIWNTSATASTIVVSPTVNTQYIVTGTIGTCVSSFTFTQLVDPCTGINSFSLDSKRLVYPNPFTNELQIQTTTETELFILDMFGELVLTKKFDSDTIVDTSTLPNGIYTVQLRNNNDQRTLRVLKN